MINNFHTDAINAAKIAVANPRFRFGTMMIGRRLAFYDNHPYAAGPQYRPRQMERFKAALAEAGIAVLAEAEHNRVIALLLDADDEAEETVHEIHEAEMLTTLREIEVTCTPASAT